MLNLETYAQHKRITRIFTLTDRANRQSIRKHRRKILKRMYSEIDASIEKRILELLREHTLTTDHRQRIVLHVASSLDDLNTNFDLWIQLEQVLTSFFSLPECEFGTAGTDYKRARHPDLFLDLFLDICCIGFIRLVEVTHLADEWM